MLDFPNPPLTAGQLYVAPNGVTYQWNTTYGVWLPVSMNFAPPVDFFATAYNVSVGTTATTMLFPSVMSGNSGNWYNAATGRFTPPPGRYHIFATASSGAQGAASVVQCYLRKNGTVIINGSQVPGTGGWWGDPAVAANLDANGTDWFDVQASNSGSGATVANLYSWFGAFALPGGARPDPPPPPPVNVWRLIQRVPISGGLANVDFYPLPADINDIELRFDVTPAVNNGNFILRYYDNTGTLDTANNYWHGNYYTYSGAAQGSNITFYSSGSNPQSGLVINLYSSGWGVSSTYKIDGVLKLNNVQSARRKWCTWQANMVEQTNAYNGFLTGFGLHYTQVAITGLRLYFDSGNFAAGGAISLWGGP